MSNFFTPVVEAIDTRSADIKTMFGGGANMSKHVAMQTGLTHPKIGGDPIKWLEGLRDAGVFMDQIYQGRRPVHHFMEAMTTDLYPLLQADTLDRTLYGAYMATPASWNKYVRRSTVNDFREVKRFATTGIRGLLKPVPEGDEHERRTMDEKTYKYAVQRYEAGFGMTFEMMVNDDLGMFRRLPNDLSDSAIDTEEWYVASLMAGPNGPNATYYNAANDNVAATNAPLTRSSLQAALTRLMKRRDERGNAILVKAVTLVVGPGLALTAREIMDAKEYRSVGSSGDVTIISGNGVAAGLSVEINYQIGSVATNANADTAWWLFADPAGTARPAMELGFLRGYETPALYEKIPDMRRFGGGAEVAWSFNTAESEKKIAHIFGGAFIDERMTIASKGDGSAVS